MVSPSTTVEMFAETTFLGGMYRKMQIGSEEQPLAANRPAIDANHVRRLLSDHNRWRVRVA